MTIYYLLSVLRFLEGRAFVRRSRGHNLSWLETLIVGRAPSYIKLEPVCGMQSKLTLSHLEVVPIVGLQSHDNAL